MSTMRERSDRDYAELRMLRTAVETIGKDIGRIAAALEARRPVIPTDRACSTCVGSGSIGEGQHWCIACNGTGQRRP